MSTCLNSSVRPSGPCPHSWWPRAGGTTMSWSWLPFTGKPFLWYVVYYFSLCSFWFLMGSLFLFLRNDLPRSLKRPITRRSSPTGLISSSSGISKCSLLWMSTSKRAFRRLSTGSIWLRPHLTAFLPISKSHWLPGWSRCLLRHWNICPPFLRLWSTTFLARRRPLVLGLSSRVPRLQIRALVEPRLVILVSHFKILPYGILSRF